MARGGKKQVSLGFEVVVAPPKPAAKKNDGPKITKEGIAADRASATAALKAALGERGKPSPGSPPADAPDYKNWWMVLLPSGGTYKVPWFQVPLRAWSKAVGISEQDIKDLLPVTRTAGKPEILEGPPVVLPTKWPPLFALRKARVIGASDLVPVVTGKLSSGDLKALVVESGPTGGRAAIKTSKEPWVFVEWLDNQAPNWRWVKGNGAALLKKAEQKPTTAKAQEMLKGSWEAVIEYDPEAGPVPVMVTLRRKVSNYATLFVQGRITGGGWKYGWEKGRGADRWWTAGAPWDREGVAASMSDAIREGLKRLLSEVIAPSCTKRDTQRPG